MHVGIQLIHDREGFQDIFVVSLFILVDFRNAFDLISYSTQAILVHKNSKYT